MRRIVILDNLRSAWNVGSIFRTSAALKFDEVVLCGVTIRPPSSKLRETSRGTEDHMTWTGYNSTLDAIAAKRADGYRIVALESGDEAKSVEEWKPSPEVAFVLGNEAKGMSRDVMDSSDEVICLPMPGGSMSINVSCAFAAMSYIDAYGSA